MVGTDHRFTWVYVFIQVGMRTKVLGKYFVVHMFKRLCFIFVLCGFFVCFCFCFEPSGVC